MKPKKKIESTTSDDDFYPEYKLNSGGGHVTITVTVKGNNNNVRIFSGQAPPPKPGGH